MTDRQSPHESATVTEPIPSRQMARGIVALVLGITGVIVGVFSSLFWLAGILGVAGLIVGLTGRVNRGVMSDWPRVLGLILSSVALVLSVAGVLDVLDVFADENVPSPTTPGVESTAPGPTPPPVPQDVEQEPARVGEIAVDHDFNFVVTAVSDDPAVIEDTDLQPEGKFVFVTLTVTNQGKMPASIPAENQYLIDSDGRTASAVVDLPEPNQSIVPEIQPGESLTGVLVFDIPADATPAGLELHGSAASAGVTVALD
jgi:hypothetical protein